MNNRSILAVALSLVLPAILRPIDAKASFVLIDNFESRNLGEIVGQGDWNGALGTGAVAIDPADQQNRALAVSTNGGHLLFPVFIEMGYSRTVFFRMRAETPQRIAIGLTELWIPFYNPSEFTDLGPQIHFDPLGASLQTHDSDLSSYVDLATISPNTWYNVWMHVEHNTLESQIWINDSVREGAAMADQLAYQGDFTFSYQSTLALPMNNLLIKTKGDSSPDRLVYVDDFHIERVQTPHSMNLTNPIPEPSSGLLVMFSLTVCFLALRDRSMH